MDLICPKCQGAMRTYERSGVTVDQCSECRGVFLDRGELERLVDAEQAWHGGRSVGESRPQQAPQQPYQQQPYQQQGYQQQGYPQYGKPHKRRKSFLEELFD
jgi:Zn-finger nucleic acid-binding protein